MKILFKPGIERRPPHRVLDIVDQGPSAYGSTFWRRLLTCEREHVLSNMLQRRGKSTEALDTGLIWHAALEAFYLKLKQLNCYWDAEAEKDAFRIIELFAKEPGYAEMYGTLSGMLNGYFEMYSNRDRWRILEVEYTVEVRPEVCGFPYSSRFDLIVADDETDQPIIRVVEHKSARALTQDILDGYFMDIQVLGQAYLMETCLASPLPWGGVVVNIATKAKEPKFDRIFVRPTKEHLESFVMSQKYLFRERTKRMLGPDSIVPFNYAHCQRRFGKCEHFDLCQNNPLAIRYKHVEALIEAERKEMEAEIADGKCPWCHGIAHELDGAPCPNPPVSNIAEVT